MDDSTIPPSSTINPIVSRLDRLDFIMKYLERRTKLESNMNENNEIGGLIEKPINKGGNTIAMDLALKEVESKGTLVDRIAALETRLFQVKRSIQICLEMEEESSGGSGSSSGTSTQSSGDTLSCFKSNTEQSSTCSLPTFNNINNNTRISQLQVMSTTHEIEEKCDEEEVDINPSPPKQKSKKKNKKQTKKEEKSEKERSSPTWLRSRLLGC